MPDPIHQWYVWGGQRRSSRADKRTATDTWLINVDSACVPDEDTDAVTAAPAAAAGNGATTGGSGAETITTHTTNKYVITISNLQISCLAIPISKKVINYWSNKKDFKVSKWEEKY